MLSCLNKILALRKQIIFFLQEPYLGETNLDGTRLTFISLNTVSHSDGIRDDLVLKVNFRPCISSSAWCCRVTTLDVILGPKCETPVLPSRKIGLKK